MRQTIIALTVVAILLFTSILNLGFVFGNSINTRAENQAENMLYGYDADKAAFNAPQGTTLVTGPWVLSKWSNANSEFLAEFNKPENSSKIPYLYLYSIAEMAKQKGGLTDCNIYNVQNPNADLCTHGTEFLTSHYWDEGEMGILNNYRKIATSIKAVRGDKPIYVHFEPDFYQYFTNWNGQGEKQNVQIDYKQGRTFAKPMIDLLKFYLPNAKIVMDISPWTDDLAGWTEQFSDIIDYVGLVGKEFKGTDYSIDLNRNYKAISNIAGKQIIVNTSQNAGNYLPIDYSWSCDNIRARHIDGVAGVIMHITTDQKGYYENLIRNC